MSILSLYEIKNMLASGLSIYDIPLAVTFYARVSTDKDEQLNSLENQIDYYEKLIRDNPNWKYIPGYVDEGISGTSTKNRKSFIRMIKDAKDKKFNLIITKEISRFSRDTLDGIKYTRELLEYGVGVFSQTDTINTFDNDSELKLTIMTSVAQDEIRKLSERVKFGHKRAIESGRVLGNNSILGYKKINGKLEVIEEEARTVRKIFDLYVNSHIGTKKIGLVLASHGILNKNGNPITQGTIKNIIVNPKYKGYYCGNKTETIDYHTKERTFIPKNKWIMYKDYSNVPPIVDEEIWDKAQEILNSRSLKSSTDKRIYQNKYPFSGKIICMEHNTSFRRKQNKSSGIVQKVIGTWRCSEFLKKNKEGCNSPMLYEEELKKIVGKSILDTMSNINIIDELIDAYKEANESKDYNVEIKEKKEELEKLENKKSKMLELILNGLIKEEDFKVQSEELINKIHTLEDQVRNLENKNSKILDDYKYLEKVKKKAIEKFEYEKTNVDELIYEFLERIEVYKEDSDNIRLKVILNTGIDFSVNLLNKKHPLCTNHTYDKSRC